jgi:hypothetical protein
VTTDPAIAANLEAMRLESGRGGGATGGADAIEEHVGRDVGR